MPEPDDSGSTLLLLPSAVLVLFLLTALAVDGAATFLAQRELADVCASAANDAAGVALEVDQLYGTVGTAGPTIDLARVLTVTRGRLAPLESRWGRTANIDADVQGTKVALRLVASVPLPIGPGGSGRPRANITATCEATTIRR
ncbi:MAG TPA: hypothetical protein VGP53_01915 [Acidimicrobiales bacterium]|nr:hypothetical protein [Acidimicrobiales bacterium]